MLRRIVIYFLSSSWLILGAAIADAHVPHDDIFSLAVSPTYSSDKTIFINVRRNLYRSEDGGKNWTRMVNGLDNKHFLQSLAVSGISRDIVYVSSLGDGIYRSTDAGASWVKANNGLKNLAIDLVAVSPYSPRVVFACGKSGGLYKTSNGGTGWREVMSEDRRITAIGFSEDKKDRIAVGTESGVLYLSDNGGEDWKEGYRFPGSGAVTAIVYPPKSSDDSVLFVGTERSGVFKTADGGASFNEMNDGLTDKHINDIKILPATAAVGYNVIVSTWDDGVFRFDRGADKWQKRSGGLVREFQAEHPEMIKEEGLVAPRPHFNDIMVSDDFVRDKTIFLGGFNGLFKSTDGGCSWRELETYPKMLVVGMAISHDYKNDSTIAVGTYAGGVYISHNAGQTWASVGRGIKYASFQLQSFARGPSDCRISTLYARIYDIVFDPGKNIFISVLWGKKDIYKIEKNGATKTPLSKNRSGSAIAISPDFLKDGIICLASQSGDFGLSVDRGMDFKKVALIGRFCEHSSISFLMSPDFPHDKTLYYSNGTATIFRSEDEGKTWRSITEGTPLNSCSQVQLAISPDYRNDRTLIAGTDEGVYVTEDAGRGWRSLGSPTDIAGVFVEAVAISPDYKNDGTFLISVRGKGLFKTEDRGGTFTHIGNDHISLSRVNAPSASMPIRFSPSYASDRTVFGYGAAAGQIYKSTNGGKDWQIIDLPKRQTAIFDRMHDALLIGGYLLSRLKSEFADKFAAFIVICGRYKRSIWRGDAGAHLRQRGKVQDLQRRR